MLAKTGIPRSFAPRNNGSDSVSDNATYRPLTAEGLPKSSVPGPSELLQLRVLRLGFFQDGDVGVGVFPEREEIVVGALRLPCVALQGVSAGEAEAGQRSPGKVPHQSAMVKELLKFRSRTIAVVEH